MMTPKERAALERCVWKHTHRDYRHIMRGQRHVLTFDDKTGQTVLVFLGHVSDATLVKLAANRRGCRNLVTRFF